jgi:hypothetical protein
MMLNRAGGGVGLIVIIVIGGFSFLFDVGVLGFD